MILAHCKNKKCEHHEITEIEEKKHSRCNKENCLAVYSNCIREAAIKKFIEKKEDQPKSALEILYPLA